MNFSYWVIIAVGALAAVSLGFIAVSPDEVIAPRPAATDAPAAAPPAPPPLPDFATVSIPAGSAVPGCEAADECYLPYAVDVAAGATVSWSNDDSAAHTVTSGNLEGGGMDGVFDSGLFAPGGTFEFVFGDAGSYDYFCIVHPWMTGIVNVAGR